MLWWWLFGGLAAVPFGPRSASCDRFAARLRLGQPDAYGAGEFSLGAFRPRFKQLVKKVGPEKAEAMLQTAEQGADA